MNNQLTIYPSKIKGQVSAPPSKSETHRAIISASLAKGESIIENVILSEDIKATINAVHAYGVKTSYNNHTLTLYSLGQIPKAIETIDCHESGSTLRFMIPLMSLSDQEAHFRGTTSLMQRPLTVYEDIFKDDGFDYNKTHNHLSIKACLKARTYHIPGNISSQFVTGLMMALPLKSQDSEIHIIGDFESKNYVLMTIKVLKAFGIDIKEIKDGYYIKGNQAYKNRNYKISGDYSQAAYFLVAGTLSNALSVLNLDKQSLQGDKAIVDIIKKAKGQIEHIENGFLVNKSNLVATKINIENCPDLGPIIALMCALSKGQSIITGTSRLRIKESDRIHSTVTVLSALGANIHTVGDDIYIEGVDILEGGLVDSFNDHRIAMMASIASLVCKNPVSITRPYAINKSYPHFYKDLEAIGFKIQRSESYENN